MPATMTTREPRATGQPLTPDQLRKIDAYWRASMYLCVGMLYLRANPLLKEPLRPEHIKRRLLGHWGSDPGQTVVLTHLNRLMPQQALNALHGFGPGRG